MINKTEVNQRFIALADRLKRDYRLKNDSELSEKLGVHRQTIYDIKKDKRSLTIDILSKLLNVFNVNIHYLLDGVGPVYLREDGKSGDPLSDASCGDGYTAASQCPTCHTLEEKMQQQQRIIEEQKAHIDTLKKVLDKSNH